MVDTGSQAYDVEAAVYDARVEGDAWMRDVLWRRYARLFRPGHTVLDIGCGTGIDARFLARRGIHVVGIDRAPSMIREARARLASEPFSTLVDLREMDVADLASLPERGFDGIVCAFASVSTVADLRGFSETAAELLRPQGTVLVHSLNRWSLWEWLGHLRHGRFRAARELGHQRERTFVIGGEAVRHYLYDARDAYERFFKTRFRLRDAFGLGILRPPHTVARIPRPVVSALQALERPVRGRRPFKGWGRFFTLELEKR
jgi:2-polyprenyl-3-methyl-5-hydroxy-6-metoxy-1,4-benzoquinol methylase